MNLKIKGTNISSSIEIISSKSELHRLLMIASQCEKPTKISFSGESSVDVRATVDCLEKGGAKIEREDNAYVVYPMQKTQDAFEINCKESGSTLRFILPFFSALGKTFSVKVEGRLSSRPLSPLYEIMTQNGAVMSENGKYPLCVSGRLKGGDFSIDGSVSSQFITGLLMSLPLTSEGGSVTVTGDFQSKPYVEITLDAMKKFGVEVTEMNGAYAPKCNKYTTLGQIKAGGDWSNGAVFACMGAIGGAIEIQGLDVDSKQGDKAVLEILKRFGAKVQTTDSGVIVQKGKLHGVTIDAKDIPDLIPPLAIVGAVSEGQTRIINAQRLRIKESDRIKSVVDMINSLGGEAQETDDGMIIDGKPVLSGGKVNSYNDHRIVMSATVGALACEREVSIIDAQAVQKSYPAFFEEVKKIGYSVEEI